MKIWNNLSLESQMGYNKSLFFYATHMLVCIYTLGKIVFWSIRIHCVESIAWIALVWICRFKKYNEKCKHIIQILTEWPCEAKLPIKSNRNVIAAVYEKSFGAKIQWRVLWSLYQFVELHVSYVIRFVSNSMVDWIAHDLTWKKSSYGKYGFE